jgi:protein SCO1/2
VSTRRPRAPRRRRTALAAACLLPGLLAACGTSAGSGPGSRPTPSQGVTLDDPVPAAVADLPLVDQAGHRFTLASLHGKTVVLADFLTLCQEICPLTSVDVEQAARAVKAGGLQDQVVFVEATVDPARDTAARLAAYQKLFPPELFGPKADWLLATGSAKDLAALWQYFGVSYDRVPEQGVAATDPPKDWLTGKPLTYDVEHQDVVWVIGPDGHRRWEENGTPDTHGQAPPTPLDRFLSQTGRDNLAAPGAQSWSAADVTAAIGYVTGRRLPKP